MMLGNSEEKGWFSYTSIDCGDLRERRVSSLHSDRLIRQQEKRAPHVHFLGSYYVFGTIRRGDKGQGWMDHAEGTVSTYTASPGQAGQLKCERVLRYLVYFLISSPHTDHL